MKLNKKNRFANCQHCFKEYLQKKSNQKFCSASCRVRNHNLNKPKSSNLHEDQPSSKSPKKSANDHLTDIAKASLPVVIDNIAKSIQGVSNADLNQKLESVLLTRKLLEQVISNQRELDSKLNELLRRSAPEDPFVIN